MSDECSGCGGSFPLGSHMMGICDCSRGYCQDTAKVHDCETQCMVCPSCYAPECARKTNYSGHQNREVRGAEENRFPYPEAQVTNIVRVKDKAYVTIRYPDTDEHYGYEKIMEVDMEDVMLAESFGADFVPLNQEYWCSWCGDNEKSSLPQNCINYHYHYQPDNPSCNNKMCLTCYNQHQGRCYPCEENEQAAESFGADWEVSVDKLTHQKQDFKVKGKDYPSQAERKALSLAKKKKSGWKDYPEGAGFAEAKYDARHARRTGWGAESFAVEATEHHEIVLEVESELRGLHKALDIVRRTQREGLHITTAEYEINKEIEFGEGVLAEITEDDFDGGSFGAESFEAHGIGSDEKCDYCELPMDYCERLRGVKHSPREGGIGRYKLDCHQCGEMYESCPECDGDICFDCHNDICIFCGCNTLKYAAESFGSEFFIKNLPLHHPKVVANIRKGMVGDTAYQWYVDGDESIQDRNGEPLIRPYDEEEIDKDIRRNIKIGLERGENKGDGYHGVDDFHDRFDERQSYGIFYSWGAESFGAEYGKRQRFGNRYVGRDTKGKFISNVSVGRSLKADRRNKSKTPARSGFGHRGDIQKGGATGFTLPSDTKRMIGMGAVLGGILAYWESKA